MDEHRMVQRGPPEGGIGLVQLQPHAATDETQVHSVAEVKHSKNLHGINLLAGLVVVVDPDEESEISIADLGVLLVVWCLLDELEWKKMGDEVVSVGYGDEFVKIVLVQVKELVWLVLKLIGNPLGLSVGKCQLLGIKVIVPGERSQKSVHQHIGVLLVHPDHLVDEVLTGGCKLDLIAHHTLIGPSF